MAVENLDQSIRFYSTLFAAEPTVIKPDYAKWMLEDPRVNFAISTGSANGAGLSHLGIQVEDSSELQEVYARLAAADRPVLEEGMTTCCYAQSEKSWISDPTGVPWEAFHTVGESTTYGTSPALQTLAKAGGCCGPSSKSEPTPSASKACCG
jgi:hypothetical protein